MSFYIKYCIKNELNLTPKINLKVLKEDCVGLINSIYLLKKIKLIE